MGWNLHSHDLTTRKLYQAVGATPSYLLDLAPLPSQHSLLVEPLCHFFATDIDQSCCLFIQFLWCVQNWVRWAAGFLGNPLLLALGAIVPVDLPGTPVERRSFPVNFTRICVGCSIWKFKRRNASIKWLHLGLIDLFPKSLPVNYRDLGNSPSPSVLFYLKTCYLINVLSGSQIVHNRIVDNLLAAKWYIYDYTHFFIYLWTVYEGLPIMFINCPHFTH